MTEIRQPDVATDAAFCNSCDQGVEVSNQWSCPKCGNSNYETDQFAATGGGFSKVFDVQNKKFTTVSCTRCHYTELYKAKTSALGNIFDFFTN